MQGQALRGCLGSRSSADRASISVPGRLYRARRSSSAMNPEQQDTILHHPDACKGGGTDITAAGLLAEKKVSNGSDTAAPLPRRNPRHIISGVVAL